MRKIILAIMVLCLSGIIIHCEKNPSGSKSEPGLSGEVRDTQGRALRDVGIHFIFVDWRDLGKMQNRTGIREEDPVMLPMENRLSQNYPNPFNPHTVFRFQLAEQSRVDLIVFDYPEYRMVDTLVSRMMSPGLYSVCWDGHNDSDRLMSNGFYPYRLTAGEFQDEKTMCIQMLDTASLAGSLPKFHTDAQGRFDISYDHIPVGKEIPFLSETADSLGTLVVPDSVTIVLTKPGYVSVSEKIEAGVNRVTDLSFVMRRAD